jgi:hypothetical protein
MALRSRSARLLKRLVLETKPTPYLRKKGEEEEEE